MTPRERIAAIIEKYRDQFTKYGLITPAGLKVSLIGAILREEKVTDRNIRGLDVVYRLKSRWGMEAQLRNIPVLKQKYKIGPDELVQLRDLEVRTQYNGGYLDSAYKRWLRNEYDIPPIVTTVKDPFWFFE
jgi:hypothetical protein